ncbi:MAG: hypothetical protein P4L10_05295 [Acidobacteriaceae bacterium]|nr:hypothetical protein [Acidobacteriaceae bacterium]
MEELKGNRASSSLVEPSADKSEVDKILEAYAKLPAATKRAIAPLIRDMSSTGNQIELLDEKGATPDKRCIQELSMETNRAANKNVGPAVVGVLFLLLSLTAAIVNLPSFLKLSQQSVYLKVMWRYFALLIALVPFIITDFMEDAPRLAHMLYTNLFPVLFFSILHAFNVYIVYFAVTQTFVVHTLLLCSIPTTFLTTWRIARRLPFTRLEYLGIGLNVFGAYLCCCEGPVPSLSSTVSPPDFE